MPDALRLGGVAALVTDGVVRDVAGVIGTGLPVWCQGGAAPPSVAGLTFVGWGEPVGCGALKFPHRRPPEIKRMWVARSARGLGVGRRLLSELEDRAAAEGARTVRLETNRSLTEAIGLYRSAGYREVAAFNDEHYAHHWFAKPLPRSA